MKYTANHKSARGVAGEPRFQHASCDASGCSTPVSDQNRSCRAETGLAHLLFVTCQNPVTPLLVP
jgi:hypothetical protein